MNERIVKLAYEVALAFDWFRSPQGYDYWSGVHKALMDLAMAPPAPVNDQLTIDGWDLT